MSKGNEKTERERENKEYRCVNESYKLQLCVLLICVCLLFVCDAVMHIYENRNQFILLYRSIAQHLKYNNIQYMKYELSIYAVLNLESRINIFIVHLTEEKGEKIISFSSKYRFYRQNFKVI